MKKSLKGNKSSKGKGFDKNPQNINRTGLNRKSPLSEYLQAIATNKGGFTISANMIIQASIEDKKDYPLITIKGDWALNKSGEKEAHIRLDVPNMKAIALQWVKDAKSKNGKIRTRSRETLIDRLEGRAKQTVVFRLDAKDFDSDLLCPELLFIARHIFMVASGKKESDPKELLKLANNMILGLKENYDL